MYFYSFIINSQSKLILYSTGLQIFTRQNSLRFHDGLFELGFLEIFTTACLLKAIIWAWVFFKYCRVLSLKTRKKKILLKKDASHLKISQEKQKKNVGKRERKTKNEKKSGFFCVAGYIRCSNKTATPAKKCIGFVDVVLRPKILGNRLGILT